MGQKKYHLINDLPHIYELEDMMEFCKKYRKLYIFGSREEQEYLLKYFDMCGVCISGYVVNVLPKEKKEFIYREMPVKEFGEVKQEESVGIILGIPDRYFHTIMPMFREMGFKDYFILSEHTKNAIACQVKPRTRDELTFEISLADHCNLSCQMCDHYSQLSEAWFVDMGRFARDMARMGELFDHKIAAIALLGGEPTLHEDIIECMRITREQFPEAELIILTNGVLLLQLEHSAKGNFWQACRDCHVHITVTVYPVKVDYEAIEKKAAEYGVSLGMSSNIHAQKSTKVVKISDKHTLDLKGQVDRFYCVNCLYFNKFNVLKDGRVYMCPVAAHIDIFNKHFNQDLKLQPEDSLDIYEIDSWEEIAEFSCRYAPFCSYCDLKHWGHHSEWKASSKKIDEYV